MARKVTKPAEFVRSISRGELYPHLKLTNEPFPRLLVTRKILNKTDEYFGAFLPTTSVRIWLYHLNRIFRLRSCDLALDGEFPRPCVLYFEKRCVAPCVRRLCGRDEYLERVQALRMFLSNGHAAFEEFVRRKVEKFAEELEFEAAAEWRDLGENANLLAANKRFDIRLDHAVDTYSVIETADSFIVYLITSRGRRLIGNKEFIFEKTTGRTAENAIDSVLRGFYLFHAPREIRLPFQLAGVKALEREFLDRLGKTVKFTVHSDRLNAASVRRLKRTQVDFDLEKVGDEIGPNELGRELKALFGLRKIPRRIETFDVAHISNRNFVTASCVSDAGEIRSDRSRFWAVEAASELDAMAAGVRDRLLDPPAPDLILVDGGKSQLNAVLEVLRQAGAENLPVIAAAKPAGKHKDISHFFTASGERIEFVPGRRVFELLRELRDEAHQNANELHRQRRENEALFADAGMLLLLTLSERKRLLAKFGSMSAIGKTPLKELAAVVGREKAQEIMGLEGESIPLPLVVTRLNEIGGAANDLRPIKARIG